MPNCFVDGRAVPQEEAVARAAALIGASRLPIIAGCGTDVAGARAAVQLADAAGAVIDHMHAEALLRDVDAMREHGMMLTTPNEARRRADVILLVGGGLEAAGLERVLPHTGRRSLEPLVGVAPVQRVVRLGLGVGPDGERAEESWGGVSLPELLQMVRARVNGRRLASSFAAVETMAGLLRAATFGVAVWTPSSLEPLAVEALCGLVKDLNAATRWSGLPLPPGDNAAGVLQVCGWMSGFPMRTSFAGGYPKHDPWQYDAVRLVESREADCVMWISAFGEHLPATLGEVDPLIVLQPGAAQAASHARVCFDIGRPGVDHDAVIHDTAFGGMLHVPASAPTGALTAAQVLQDVASAMRGTAAC